MLDRDENRQRVALRKLLREMRVEANLRQVDVARSIGKPQPFVSKYESGERRLDLVELRLICDALGFSLEDVLRRLDEVN